MRHPPIRVRLTAWYLTVILASLAVAAFWMYSGMERAIEETVDNQLQVRIDNVKRYLQSAKTLQAAASPQLLPPSIGLGPADELYQVTDGSGNMLFQSPAMHELEVPLQTTQLHHHYRHHRDQGDFTTYYRRHGDVRVLASGVQVGSQEYRVQVASDVNPQYDVLETFRNGAWTILPLIVFLAGVGGYWLSGRAMQPVHDLVLSTREISERSLSKRIPVPAAQDELRELAQTMNSMLGRLESAFVRMTRFTSDASHELRTPITVIRTTSEVILEKERSIEEIKGMVELILRESESTSELIEQLLTLVRADAGTEHLSLEELDLRAVVEDVDSSSRTLASTHGVTWRTELTEEPVLVLGDRSHLRRMLIILVENAFRYTEKGGSVLVRLRVQETEALMEVIDSGIGIPPDELTQIFDRFYRASNARFFDPDGTGLGLPIAQWIATAHRGTVTAQSTLGAGTRMQVRLHQRQGR